MKILENRICELGSSIAQFEAFEKLNVSSTKLKSLPLPLGIVVIPGYTDSKKVCYHHNLPSLLSSIICSNPRDFSTFVNNYCNDFNYSCKLLDEINDTKFTEMMLSDDIINLSDNLLKFLGTHREKLREFVSLLRINRPVFLENSFDNINTILESSSKYYISCFLIEDLECYDSMLTVLGDFRYTGSFNINFGLSNIEKYKSVIETNYKSVDIFSLEMALSNCIVDLSSTDICNSSEYAYYCSDSLLKNSIIYDLVYMTLNNLWRI